MKHPEDLLGEELSFDAFIEEVEYEMHDHISDIQIEYGDVIDTSQEFEGDFLERWKLSGYMAAALKSPDEELKVVQSTMYRAMSFSLQIVEEIRSSPIKTLEYSTIEPQPDSHSPESEIAMQTSQYLSTRPNIDNLLAYYMPEIDPTFRHNHHAETAASLMFMLAERQQAEEVLAGQTEDVTPEMFDRYD